MDKTRIGVIGLGTIAQLVHLPIINKLNNVQLVGLAEINKNRLQSIGEKYPSANRYTDYKEMLGSEKLDAVIITTPTNSHTQIAIDSIKAKTNILIEKPIALNVTEAKEISAIAKKNKKIAMVGMNLRFRPDAMLMRSLINAGDLGDIFYIKCGWIRKQSSTQKWFMKKNEAGGGVVIDLGILLLDLALWMLSDSKVESVSIQKYNHTFKEIEDTAIGMIRLENSKIINFEVSWKLHTKVDGLSFSVHGTKGMAQLNPLQVYKFIESSSIDISPSKSGSSQGLYRKSYENELKHFIANVRTGIPVISSAEEAVNRMELLEKIYISAEQEKEIKM